MRKRIGQWAKKSVAVLCALAMVTPAVPGGILDPETVQAEVIKVPADTEVPEAKYAMNLNGDLNVTGNGVSEEGKTAKAIREKVTGSGEDTEVTATYVTGRSTETSDKAFSTETTAGILVEDLALDGTYTVSVWVKHLAATGSDYTPFIFVAAADMTDQNWFAMTGRNNSAGRARVVSVMPNGDWQKSYGDLSFSYGETVAWTNYTMSVDEEKGFVLYQNGVPVVSDELSGAINTESKDVMFAMNYWTVWDGIPNCLFDDVQIYDDALTAEQAQKLYMTDTGEQLLLAVGEDRIGLEDTTTATVITTGDSGDVTFQSSEPQIASVTDDGVITGHSEGTVTITATVGNISKSVTVKVDERVDWTIHEASPNNNDGSNMIDDNLATQWNTGGNVSWDGGTDGNSSNPDLTSAYFIVDFGKEKTFNQIRLDSLAGGWAHDYAGKYEIYAANDLENLSEVCTGTEDDAPFVVADGIGIQTITFPTRTARYLKVVCTQTRSADSYWSVREVYVDCITRIHGQNLTLGDDISVNYYMTIPSLDDVVVKLKKGNNEEIDVTDQLVCPDATKPTEYKYTCGVAAKEMTEKLVVTVYDKGNNVLSTTEGSENCTVQQYAKTILSDPSKYAPEGKEEELEALMKALLRYGAKAQKYFYEAVEDSGLADAITEMDEYKADETITASNFGGEDADLSDTPSSNDVVARFYGSSLITESKTTIRHYFEFREVNDPTQTYYMTYGDGTAREGLTSTKLKIDDQDVTVYYADIKDIVAQDLDKDYTAWIVDGDGKQVSKKKTYSAFTYAYLTLTYVADGKIDDPKLSALVKALVNYGQAANNYFEPSVQEE